MATTTNFDAMIRSYAPNTLFREELTKRDWFLSNVERDDTWLGGDLEVRFKGASASSVKLGSLTDASDIAQSVYALGTITNQPEVWGSLIFNETDLMRNGKLSEQNFLKLLPGEVEDFSNFMKMMLSLQFTNGPILSTAALDGTNLGVMQMTRVERFEVGQKIYIQDDNTAAAAYYVTAINMETEKVTVSATRGGAVADISAYTTAQNARCYPDGAQTSGNRVTNLKNSLLSSANGGDSTIYGLTKVTYPYTQAINVSGADITSVNILDKMFLAQTKVRNKGKGNPNTFLVSYKHLGSILMALEATKGAYRQANDMKASLYGWTEIEIVGVKGSMKIVAIQEMDDDYIAILDMSALKVYSNGFVKKRQNPDGREYYEIRNTTGYQYIIDLCFFGDMVLERPSRCGILYSISYT